MGFFFQLAVGFLPQRRQPSDSVLTSWQSCTESPFLKKKEMYGPTNKSIIGLVDFNRDRMISKCAVQLRNKLQSQEKLDTLHDYRANQNSQHVAQVRKLEDKHLQLDNCKVRSDKSARRERPSQSRDQKDLVVMTTTVTPLYSECLKTTPPPPPHKIKRSCRTNQKKEEKLFDVDDSTTRASLSRTQDMFGVNISCFDGLAASQLKDRRKRYLSRKESTTSQDSSRTRN